MKHFRSPNVRFSNGQMGAAIAAHIIIKAQANRISRINRDGVVTIRLTAKTNPEINSRLADYIATALAVPENRVEIVGKDDSPDRLVTVTGLSAAELQHKITALLV